MDKHNWDAQADQLEQEGTDLLGVVTTAATWASQLRGPVRSVIDLGSGPGVGTCELARCFSNAHVVAVDASDVMLKRVSARSRTLGLDDRVSTQLAELPAGLVHLPPADIVFASMSLHHMPNPDEALAAIRLMLAQDGLLIVIEHAPGARRDHRPVIDASAALVANRYDVIGERVSAGRSLIIARVASD